MVFTWADPHVQRMTMCEYACLAHRPMMTRMQGTGYIPSPSYADWKAWRNVSLGAICQDISTQSALYASVSVLCASHLQCEPMPARISFPGHVSLFLFPAAQSTPGRLRRADWILQLAVGCTKAPDGASRSAHKGYTARCQSPPKKMHAHTAVRQYGTSVGLCATLPARLCDNLCGVMPKPLCVLLRKLYVCRCVSVFGSLCLCTCVCLCV